MSKKLLLLFFYYLIIRFDFYLIIQESYKVISDQRLCSPQLHPSAKVSLSLNMEIFLSSLSSHIFSIIVEWMNAVYKHNQASEKKINCDDLG